MAWSAAARAAAAAARRKGGTTRSYLANRLRSDRDKAAWGEGKAPQRSLVSTISRPAMAKRLLSARKSVTSSGNARQRNNAALDKAVKGSKKYFSPSKK